MKRQIAFSARSQRSVLEERQLEEQEKRCGVLIEGARRRFAEAERSVQACVNAQTSGQGGNLAVDLPDRVRARDDANLEIKTLKAQLGNLRAKLRAVRQSTPTQKAERRREQAALAHLSGELLAVDRELGSAAARLRALVEKREQLKAAMEERAQRIGLGLSGEGFAGPPIGSLLDALPVDCARETEAWRARLVGETRTEPTRKYLVLGQVLLTETLHHHGVCGPGDIVRLNQTEARRIVSGHENAPPIELAEGEEDWPTPLVKADPAPEAGTGWPRRHGHLNYRDKDEAADAGGIVL